MTDQTAQTTTEQAITVTIDHGYKCSCGNCETWNISKMFKHLRETHRLHLNGTSGARSLVTRAKRETA